MTRRRRPPSRPSEGCTRVGRPPDRLDTEGFSDGLHRLKVAFLAVGVALQLVPKRGGVVLERSDADVLRAPQLEEKAVLRVEVHRRRRGRAGDEQVARPEPHSPLTGGNERLHLVQAVVDDLGILGTCWMSRREMRKPFCSTSRTLADGGPSPRPRSCASRRSADDLLTPHGVRWQPVGELGDRFHREQRVIGEIVRHRKRSPREHLRERLSIDLDMPSHIQAPHPGSAAAEPLANQPTWLPRAAYYRPGGVARNGAVIALRPAAAPWRSADAPGSGTAAPVRGRRRDRHGVRLQRSQDAGRNIAGRVVHEHDARR